MLGTRILDPELVESDRDETMGMGLLSTVTQFSPHKQTHQVSGKALAGAGLLQGADGLPFEGYEIHMGSTTTDSVDERPFRLLIRSGEAVDEGEGMSGGDGWILGTYVHGLFHNADLRRSILKRIAERKGVCLPPAHDGFSQDREYDKLAALVRASLDMERLREIVGLPSEGSA